MAGEGNIAGSEPIHGLVILTVPLLRKCVFFPLSLCLFREAFILIIFLALLKNSTFLFFLLINLLPKIVGHVLFELSGRKVCFLFVCFICLFLLSFFKPVYSETGT